MKEEGFINDEQFQQALKRKLTIKSEKAQYPKKAPYFLEHIRQRIERKYGRHLLYKGGLKVYTTVNLKMQEAAQKAIKRGLYELDKREGFRSPTRRFLFSGEETLNKSKPKILSKNTLEIGTITQGTVIKVDSKNKETLVQIEDKKGILPLSNMKWARMVDPEKAYFESKLQDPADVLTPGDIITVKIVKKSKDSSELI
ncbi:MAG: penicillin-binding protein, partial [Deltaproteobacteria bacterium]